MNPVKTKRVTASPTNPGAIDFSMLSDVTGSFSVSYGHTSFNNGTNILYAEYTAQNVGSYWVRTPLVVEVTNISDPSVRVAQNTGLRIDGTPFYDLSSLVSTTAASGAVAIGPGQSTQTATLAFSDPNGTPFTYTLVFLGRLNHPPRFTSVPVVTVMAGQTYNYTTTAVDPENDYLIFSKVSGPANLYFSDTHAGTLTWVTATTDAGTYPIRLRVSDNNGGTADQVFILSVVASGMNYPPYFTSTPVVDANVASLYSYQATVGDLDNDAQSFTLLTTPAVSVNPPAGLTVSSTGLVQWTPTAGQLGSWSVTLQDTDAGGLYAQQTYSILVQQSKGNLAPIFTLGHTWGHSAFFGREVSASVPRLRGCEKKRLVTPSHF